MKYPITKFSKVGQPKENGRSVYSVMRFLAPRDSRVVGEIAKTANGTWNLKINSRHNIQVDEELQRLSDAKQRARELMD